MESIIQVGIPYLDYLMKYRTRLNCKLRIFVAIRRNDHHARVLETKHEPKSILSVCYKHHNTLCSSLGSWCMHLCEYSQKVRLQLTNEPFMYSNTFRHRFRSLLHLGLFPYRFLKVHAHKRVHHAPCGERTDSEDFKSNDPPLHLRARDEEEFMVFDYVV